MTFDPQNPLAKPEHSKADCARFFGRTASGSQAQLLKEKNPQLYDAIRASAVEHKLVAALPWYKSYTPPVKEADRQFSEVELEARSRHSEADTRAFFANQGARGASAPASKVDKETYESFRSAAVSYRLLDARATAPTPEPKAPAPADDRFPLSDENCNSMNLPRGHRVNLREYEVILKLMEAAKVRKDDEAKAALLKAQADAAAEQAAEAARPKLSDLHGKEVKFS